MTDDELRTLVASLAISTANNEHQARANAEAIESQGRTMLEGLASLQASSESQVRSIETMRESMTYNTDTVASALELAAEALKLSANTSRNLDRLEQDIADLKQIVGIVIR